MRSYVLRNKKSPDEVYKIAYETIIWNAQMKFINLHLIDVYFMVKLEVDELSKLLCMKNQKSFWIPGWKKAEVSGLMNLWNKRDFTVRRLFMIGTRTKS